MYGKETKITKAANWSSTVPGTPPPLPSCVAGSQMWTHSELPATSCQMPCSPLTICFSQQFHHQWEKSPKWQYNQSEQAKSETANLALQYLKQCVCVCVCVCVCGHGNGKFHVKKLTRQYIRGMAQVQFTTVHNVFGSGKFPTIQNVFWSGKFTTTYNVFESGKFTTAHNVSGSVNFTTAHNIFGTGKFTTAHNVFESGKFTTAYNVFGSVTFTTVQNVFESVNFTTAHNIFGSGKFTTAHNVFVTNHDDRQLIHLLQIQNVSFHQQWTMIVPGHSLHQTQFQHSVKFHVMLHLQISKTLNAGTTCAHHKVILAKHIVKVKVKFSPCLWKRNGEA